MSIYYATHNLTLWLTKSIRE